MRVQNGVTSDNVYQMDSAGNRVRVFTSGVVQVSDWSYEEPAIADFYLYNPNGPGVLFENHSGVTGNGSSFAFAPAPSGHQVAFIQSASPYAAKVTHTVEGLTPGRAYVVRFKIARRPGFALNSVSVS